MNELIFIDVEASGLALESYPIEIAIQLNGEIYSWLIVPEPGWVHWDKQAEAMHGLTRNELSNNGAKAEHVAKALNERLASTNGLVYSDAEKWDSDWVATLFYAVKIPASFTILPIENLLTLKQQYQFKNCLEGLFAADSRKRHRAATDVELIAKAYALVCQDKL